MRARVFTFPFQRQRDLLTELTHPANLFSGHPHHQSIGLDVFIDYGPSTDECIFANGAATNNGAVCSKCGALLNNGVTVFALPFDKRARVVNVRENHAWAAEHAFIERDVIVNTDVILDLAAVANNDLVSNKDVLA